MSIPDFDRLFEPRIAPVAFAKSGEPVTDQDGNVICSVKNDLHLHMPVSVKDFHEFSEGETPWVEGQIVDSRCVRSAPDTFGFQIRINGEWRP